MTCRKRILTLILSAVLLLGCLSPVFTAAEPYEPEEKYSEEMTELYPLNDVFLSNCMEGIRNFSVTILPEAWKDMTLDELTETVLFIGKRWCIEDLRLDPHENKDGSVRYDIYGARPRDGIRMSFGIDLSASDQACLDAINAVVDGFISEYGWDQILVETAIYDWICDHMEYHSFDEFPSGDIRQMQCTSAITAFREGWGNCQAYSDLFYIMASRAGLQPGYISGNAGGWHLWNFVCLQEGLSDVRNLMVDVTFGDSTESHYYLNFGLDRATDRTWHEDLWAYGFEQTTDDFYSYYGLYSMDYGLAAQTYEEAATFFVWKGAAGYAEGEVLLPGIWYLDGNRMDAAIRAKMEQNRASGAYQFKWMILNNGDVIVKVSWTDFSS